MRHLAKTMLVCLAVISIAVFLNSKVFAAVSWEQTHEGEPPYGLAVQGDAAGQRLIGEVYTEDYNYNAVKYAQILRAVVRLRKGSDEQVGNLKTFSTELDCSNTDLATCCQGFSIPVPNSKKTVLVSFYDTTNAICVQTAITNALKDDILYYFFQDTNLTMVLRFVDELASVLDESSSVGFPPTKKNLMDIELAVK